MDNAPADSVAIPYRPTDDRHSNPLQPIRVFISSKCDNDGPYTKLRRELESKIDETPFFSAYTWERDIEVLREFGCVIRSFQRNPVEYALIRRQFKLPELMLMVDTVQSSKALTVRQSNALVTNIKLLASDHERALLERRIHVPGRIKTKTDCVFGNVDIIHEAMRLRRKVEFTYYRRNVEGERYETREGRPHVVTPVEIVYSDGFY